MARSIEQRGHHVTCVLIGTSHKLAAYKYTYSLALWTTLECELVDANEVCQGIQKVRVEPATRSAVATWKRTKKKYRIKKRNKQKTNREGQSIYCTSRIWKVIEFCNWTASCLHSYRLMVAYLNLLQTYCDHWVLWDLEVYLSFV